MCPLEAASCPWHGFSEDELLGFTREAVRASFAPAERLAPLLSELQGDVGSLPA